jgi:1-deoxy-D-xylulose-5-phosphate synthase
MVVMAPSDENELCRMLVTALSHSGPIALRYPRGAAVGKTIERPIMPLPVGTGEVLEKGNDLLILAVGRPVNDALSARIELLKQNIAATVVNCRFVKPLDADLIVSLVEKIPHIITVEENVLHGGFGAAVIECLCDKGLTGFSIKRIGVPDTFVEHGAQSFLRAKYGLDATGIVKAAHELLSGIYDVKTSNTA